jgi:hypothetical protein
MHLGLVSLQSTWLDLVCALLVCALLVCALLVCVHDCASSHEPLPPSISIQDAAADGQ